jgi:microcystin-dependent protein
MEKKHVMDPILGQLILLPYSTGFALNGWLICDGRTLNIQQYTALFSLLGTRFGGNGQTNFALPKLAPVQAGGEPIYYYIATEGVYPQRAD